MVHETDTKENLDILAKDNTTQELFLGNRKIL